MCACGHNPVTESSCPSFPPQHAPTVQVISVTYLPLVGYTILLRDLLAPIMEVILDRTLDGVARNIMVSALVVLVSTPPYPPLGIVVTAIGLGRLRVEYSGQT